MKKKVFVLFAAAVAGVLVLTSCTSSEQGTAPSSGTQNAGTGTQAGTQSVSGAVTDSGDGSSSGVSDSQASGSGQTTDNSGATQDVSGTAQNAPEAGGGPAEDGEPVGDVIPDEDADAAENDTEDPALAEGQDQADEWSGTYIADEETVTISMIDSESISFSFAQSGISGIATVNGYQAVYNGDDHHVVVFNLNNDTVDVSVSSEEDFDASASPLIGHYVKEQ